MKKLYLLPMLSLVIFILLGTYFIYDLISGIERGELIENQLVSWIEIRYLMRCRFLMNVYAKSAVSLFVISSFWGWRMGIALKHLGVALLLEIGGFFIWFVLMTNDFSHINYEEVYTVWGVYSLGAIGLAFFIMKNYDKELKVTQSYEDHILDDEMIK